MMKNIKVYLDMDNTIVDTETALNNHPKVKSFTEREFNKVLAKAPKEYHNLGFYALKEKLKADPRLNDVEEIKNLNKSNQILRGIIYSVMETEGFFLNLKPLPYAHEMVSKIIEMTDVLPNILTAHVKGPYCAKEKEEWMKIHFPKMYNEFHCRKDKHFFAAPDSVLIDDAHKFINPWVENGGHGILHKDPYETLLKLATFLGESAKYSRD